MTAFDVAVLAGGDGRRLRVDGRAPDKALVDVGGRTLLERVLAACDGAVNLVVVGPRRDVSTGTSIIWCREEPPGGGPVAAIDAAMPHMSAKVVVVLAVDHPFVDATTIRALVDAAADHDGAHAVDTKGHVQPLLAAYQRAALATALARTNPLAGARVRDLIAMMDLAGVAVGLAALDCDTPADVERAGAIAATDHL